MVQLIENGIPNESPGIRVLWTKSSPRHPLWKHLLDSAAVFDAVSISNTCPFESPLEADIYHIPQKRCGLR